MRRGRREYSRWPEYVTVAERRADAQKHLDKLRKKGVKVQPVELSGRKIADSFWGKGWCDHMESFSDFANRLPRGRTYIRNGSVCHLDIRGGRIEAMVSGTTLYNVSIAIKPLPKTKWSALKRACSGRIGSLIDLLRGKLDRGVMEVVSDRRQGLFPLPGEMKFDCDCPDWADMCKHVAAVLYGVGSRLDHSPEMLFLLRGVDHEELVDVSAALTDATRSGTSRRRIAAAGIADVFGIDMAETGEPPSETDAASAAGRPKPKTKTSKPGNESEAPSRARGGRKKNAPVQSKERKEAPAAPFPEPLTGEAIRAWRSSLGETQAAFASRIGITAASISQWEKKGKGTLGMQPRTLTALRKAWRLTNR
ncbi:SWIM zinc finger family protein [Geoalkalibacter halelectricus]|uniref:SWIM zinc finger family protein n=1 Tax=Geoalkalibacter halelectricus TaxID=2847045 RepID=A0ABY5ZJ90_9BACT|nr:SWIM zinc finger family protein [Geoalkalibacter halelectricus]MDO3377314.1 SWIM zinc finger family protein [Geoalkalibacter halelectricus]UWZ79186.1 SWIM zinc finger family protein [Geoalkalibacter halelectricus]